MVLHHESGILFPQPILSRDTDVIGESDRGIEGHLSYDFKPRLWVSLDGNFWYGGETSLSGVPNAKTTERNSRIGATASIPISKHQSLKFSYNNGAYINYGGNFQNVSVAWQYSWIGWPK
jgi:hypothetical protein